MLVKRNYLQNFIRNLFNVTLSFPSVRLYLLQLEIKILGLVKVRNTGDLQSGGIPSFHHFQ